MKGYYMILDSDEGRERGPRQDLHGGHGDQKKKRAVVFLSIKEKC